MVMVKRSLEAANAINAGNNTSRIASVSITVPLATRPDPSGKLVAVSLLSAKHPPPPRRCATAKAMFRYVPPRKARRRI
jgi:hypothetical protein